MAWFSRLSSAQSCFNRWFSASILAVGLDSPAAVPLFQQMHATDFVNQGYVHQLLATAGWPTRSQVGDTAARTVYLVVQHTGRAAIAQHLPAMRRLVRQGEAQATDAATMAVGQLAWSVSATDWRDNLPRRFQRVKDTQHSKLP